MSLSKKYYLNVVLLLNGETHFYNENTKNLICLDKTEKTFVSHVVTTPDLMYEEIENYRKTWPDVKMLGSTPFIVQPGVKTIHETFTHFFGNYAHMYYDMRLFPCYLLMVRDEQNVSALMPIQTSSILSGDNVPKSISEIKDALKYFYGRRRDNIVPRQTIRFGTINYTQKVAFSSIFIVEYCEDAFCAIAYAERLTAQYLSATFVDLIVLPPFSEKIKNYKQIRRDCANVIYEIKNSSGVQIVNY